jgi:hypothetical protein
LRKPWVLVDEFGQLVTHPWLNQNQPFFGTRLRINHYRLRSAEEFAEKLARWKNNDHPEFRDPEAVRLYWERNDQCEILDDTIQRFVPALRQSLACT